MNILQYDMTLFGSLAGSWLMLGMNVAAGYDDMVGWFSSAGWLFGCT